MQRWANFDIELADYDVVGDAASARVRVARSPAGEQRDAQPVTIPPLLRKTASRLANADITLVALVEIGEALSATLLPAQARTLYHNSLSRLDADEGLRLRILVRSLQLAELPWELLYLPPSPGTPTERGFLALDRRQSIVRYEPVSQPQDDWQPQPGAPLHVALLLADPEIPGWERLELGRERQAVEAALHDEADVALQVHGNATGRRLNDVLDARPHVFHFAGHGRFVMQPGERFGEFTGSGELLFETDSGTADPVPARELAARMRGSGVRLAVLNSCDSARRDDVDAFTGIAPALVRDGVPAVVAMQYRIRDSQALVFARRLYHNLAAHQSVDSAVAAARIAMFEAAAGRGWDFAVPTLYLRSDQSVLFPDPDAPVTETAPARRFTRQAIVNVALAAALVFALAFFYLRHIEPRLPFGTVIGGFLAAAAVATVAFVSTVTGDAVRGIALGVLRQRRATVALAVALFALAAATLVTPAPVALRVLPGMTLIGRLAPAGLDSPQRIYTLEVDSGGASAAARDFRKCGVVLAGSAGLAARLNARNTEALDAGMDDYLQRQRLVGQGDRFLERWRLPPEPLAIGGMGRAAGVTLTLRHDGAPVACRRVTPAELSAEMNVVFMEDGDACD